MVSNALIKDQKRDRSNLTSAVLAARGFADPVRMNSTGIPTPGPGSTIGRGQRRCEDLSAAALCPSVKGPYPPDLDPFYAPTWPHQSHGSETTTQGARNMNGTVGLRGPRKKARQSPLWNCVMWRCCTTTLCQLLPWKRGPLTLDSQLCCMPLPLDHRFTRRGDGWERLGRAGKDPFQAVSLPHIHDCGQACPQGSEPGQAIAFDKHMMVDRHV